MWSCLINSNPLFEESRQRNWIRDVPLWLKIANLVHTNFPYPLMRSRMCVYQGERNVSFSKHSAYVLNGWSPVMLVILVLFLDDNGSEVYEAYLKSNFKVRPTVRPRGRLSRAKIFQLLRLKKNNRKRCLLWLLKCGKNCKIFKT